jgi:hypothetical protein
MALHAVFNNIWGDWMLILLFLSSLCVVVFVAQTIGAWYRLRHFKGPFPATFSNIWLLRAVLNGRMHWDILEVNRKYGKVPLWDLY